MTYRIHLTRESDVDPQTLKKVRELLVKHPGPVELNIRRRKIQLPRNEEEVIPWDPAFSALAEYTRKEDIPSEDYLLALTTANNERNWYATQDPANLNVGFAQVADFSWVTTAPNWAIISHYVFTGLLKALLKKAGVDWMDAGHMTPRGCFSDFCPLKSDLGLKLRTADICGDCMHLFASSGIDESLIQQIISVQETIRLTALSTTPYLKPPGDFEAWPFPAAITRHKVAQTTKPVLRMLLLLDHFDCLVRYSYLANELISGREPEVVDKPALGWWVTQLARSFKNAPDLKPVVAIAEKAHIVALRNERRGHGWMNASEEAYLAECASLEKALSEIEATLAPILHGYCLLRPREITLRDGQHFIEGDRLAGSHILHPPFSLLMTGNPADHGLKNTGRIYLVDAAMQTWFDMTPHLIGAICPQCNHQRILITDGEDTYIDTQIGHRVTLTCH